VKKHVPNSQSFHALGKVTNVTKGWEKVENHPGFFLETGGEKPIIFSDFGSHLIFGTQNREEKGDPCFGFCSMVFLLFSLPPNKKKHRKRESR